MRANSNRDEFTTRLSAENSELFQRLRECIQPLGQDTPINEQAHAPVRQDFDLSACKQDSSDLAEGCISRPGVDRFITNVRLKALTVTMALAPITAHADFESSLQGIVNFVITRIMPVIALYYFAEAIFFQLAHRPDAKDRIKSAMFGAIALFGVNGLWLWLKSQVR